MKDNKPQFQKPQGNPRSWINTGNFIFFSFFLVADFYFHTIIIREDYISYIVTMSTHLFFFCVCVYVFWLKSLSDNHTPSARRTLFKMSFHPCMLGVNYLGNYCLKSLLSYLKGVFTEHNSGWMSLLLSACALNKHATVFWTQSFKDKSACVPPLFPSLSCFFLLWSTSRFPFYRKMTANSQLLTTTP